MPVTGFTRHENERPNSEQFDARLQENNFVVSFIVLNTFLGV